MKKVNIPKGQSGDWSVEKFTISKDEARWSAVRDGYRAVREGEYTKLVYKGHIIMSDTQAEMIDHWEPVRYARGHILINGLGIGMVLLNCMKKEAVERATVIELSSDVISLVAPYYQEMFGDKIEIIQADALTWKPPKGIKYDMVWHDIWPDICGDNYEEMKKLHRRFGRFADWQGSWCRREMKRLAC